MFSLRPLLFILNLILFLFCLENFFLNILSFAMSNLLMVNKLSEGSYILVSGNVSHYR